MTPKLFKRTLRFIENLIFVKVPVTNLDVEGEVMSKSRSWNDLTVDPAPELDYRSLRRPKGQRGPLHIPPMGPLPTLIHLNEVDHLITDNSARISDLENMLSSHSSKDAYLETLV